MIQPGDQLRLRHVGAWPRLVRVVKIEGPDHDRDVVVQAVLHQDVDGDHYEPTVFHRLRLESLDLEIEAGDAVAPHVVQALRCIDYPPEQRETVKHKVKASATVHMPDGTGGVLCGVTLRRDESLPRRWCDWRKKWLPPRDESSVWMPTFRELTCTRCRAKGEKDAARKEASEAERAAE